VHSRERFHIFTDGLSYLSPWFSFVENINAQRIDDEES